MKLNLYNGDCLEDPPYGITACKWDSVIPLDEVWERLSRLVKPNGAIVLFGGEPFSSVLRMSNSSYKYDWKWIKNNATGFLNAKKQPLRTYEDICIFYEKQCTYNPQKTLWHKPVHNFTKHGYSSTIGKAKIGFSGGGSTSRYPTNVLYFPTVNHGFRKYRSSL